LSGANTFNGTTNITAGNVTLANNNALQNSTLTYGSGLIKFATGVTAPVIGAINSTQALALNTATGQSMTLFTGGDNASTTFAAVISGNTTGVGNLTKQGSGVLTLTTTNTYNGLTTITGGLINFSNITQFGANTSTNSILLSGTTGQGGGIQWQASTLDVSKNITIGGGSTALDILDTNTNNVNLAAAALTGTGVLVKQNDGTLTLTQAEAYNGVYSGSANSTFLGSTTVITGGTLQLGNGAVNGSVLGQITDNSFLTYNENGNRTFSNNITGTGNVTFIGTNTTTLSGTNSYTGKTVIQSGATLILGGNQALGGTTLAFNTTNGNLSFTGLPGSNATFGGLSGNGNIDLDVTPGTSSALALTVGGNGQSTTYTGVFSGNGSLIKAGTGILSLTAANT
jgi:autotransporter-associated beta strand protein